MVIGKFLDRFDQRDPLAKEFNLSDEDRNDIRNALTVMILGLKGLGIGIPKEKAIAATRIITALFERYSAEAVWDSCLYLGN